MLDASEGRNSAASSSSLDVSRAKIGFLRGHKPRFADETAGLLRKRLKAAALVLSIALALAFIGNLYAGGAPLLGETGAIVPITDFTEGPNGIDRSQIYDAFWEYNSIGGQVWSMPFNNSVPVLYYNRDLFIAAGLDPDNPPTTWEEVVEYGQALTQDTDDNGEIDQWGFNTHSDTHWYLSTMFLQNGAQIVNEEQTEMLYNSPEAVEMLQI